MRFRPIILATASFLSAAAHAQASPPNADTYREVAARGVVIMLPEMEIDVQFKPDGTFTALGGMSSGKWRLDGERMCSTPNETLIESCAVYPAGKKSGDTFLIPAPGGDVTIRIP
jgi:hypothetical protein